MQINFETLFEQVPQADEPKVEEFLGEFGGALDVETLADMLIGVIESAKYAGVDQYQLIERALLVTQSIRKAMFGETEGIINPVTERTAEEQAAYVADELGAESVSEEQALERLNAEGDLGGFDEETGAWASSEGLDDLEDDSDADNRD